MSLWKTLLLIPLLSACATHNGELRVLNGVITAKVENERLRVRVHTGVDECRWSGKYRKGDYQVQLQCTIPTNNLKLY